MAEVQDGIDFKALPTFSESGETQGQFVQRMADKQKVDKLEREQTQSMDWQKQLSMMPNADKVSPIEKKLYKILPGFAGDPLLSQLSKVFSSSIGGKILGVIDAWVEFNERGASLLNQGAYAIQNGKFGEFVKELDSAWYAGALGADLASFPTLEVTPDGWKFNIEGDMPGTAGVVAARKRIEELVANGMSMGEALQVAKDEVYRSLGALQMRALVQDTFLHIFGDPVNYILPGLKVVDSAQIARKAILSVGIADDSIDVMKAALVTAKNAGDLAEVERITGALNALDKLGRQLNPLQNFFTRNSKFTLALTGGIPGVESKASSIIKNIPVFNMFMLSPQARAYELVTMATDNIGTYILSKFGPEEATNLIKMAAKGVVDDPRMAHMFLTYEGRVIQSTLKGIDTKMDNLLAQWRLTNDERVMLSQLAKAIDETPYTLMNKITSKIDDVSAITNALRSKGIRVTDDDLVRMANLLKDTPYTQDLFIYMARNEIADHVGRVGTIMYGIKPRGGIEKVMMAVKEVETLGFLRLNYFSYPIKNAVNNETTMIARFGNIAIADVDDMVEDLGFIPYRLEQAWGAAGYSAAMGSGKAPTKISEQIAKAAGAAPDPIAQALRGEEGLLEKFTDAVNGIKLPKIKVGETEIPLDAGKWAQAAEVSARKRGMAFGYAEYLNTVWKPGSYPHIRDALEPGLLSKIDDAYPGLVDEVNSLIRSSKASESKLDSLLNIKNIKLNPESIFEEASKKAGFDVRGIFGEDYMMNFSKGLQEAASGGDVNKITDFIAGERFKWQKYLDGLDDMLVENTAKEWELLAGEGPMSWANAYGTAWDEFTEAHLSYFTRMESIQDDIRRLTKPDLVDRFWKNLFDETDGYFKRAFNRLDGSLTGIKRAAKADGYKVPDEVLDSFKVIKQETSKFFKSKRGLWDDYWKAIKEGKTPAKNYDEISEIINTSYTKLIEKERELYQKMDDLVAGMITDPAKKESFIKWRSKALELKYADKEEVLKFWQSIRGSRRIDIPDKFNDFFKSRIPRWKEIDDIETAGKYAMMGDAKAQKFVDDLPSPVGAKVPAMITNDMKAKLTDMGFTADDIAKMTPQQAWDELAKAAPEAGKVTEEVSEAVARYNVGSADDLFERMFPQVAGQDQLLLNKGALAFDAIEEGAISQASKSASRFSDLPQDIQDALNSYIRRVKGSMSDIRYGALRYAEYKADSALLNYNRRYNYNTMLGMIAPYEFWFTQSIMKWAIHSIDRPAMLSSYLRIKKFMDMAGLPNQNVPSRARGHFRIRLPFAPEWMGDSFIDPFRLLLPFRTFNYPLETMAQNNFTAEQKAVRLLTDWLAEGRYNIQEIQSAMKDKSGTLWNMAIQQVKMSNEDLETDMFDIMNLFFSMHAPLQWAKEVMDGTPENIQPATPLQRMIKQFTGLIGIDWDNSPLNVEGRVRKWLGLPVFDKWDDYRTDRMLSNMVAMGDITVNEARRAMIERSGEIFDKAVELANKEYGVGIVGTLLGLPTKAYPPGEEYLRSLNKLYQNAWKSYNDGNPQPLNEFNKKYPEYEARLALFESPEKRLQSFLVDELWSKWNELPSLHKKEIVDQFGADFEQKFINKETRSYDTISAEMMQMWLLLMGGDPPGMLPSTPTIPLKLTDSDIAWRAQVFYDTRKELYPDYYELQNQYYDLPETGNSRKLFKASNPQLVSYWNWRRNFLYKNPELAPYLVEDESKLPEYKSEKERAKLAATEPNYSKRDWAVQLGDNLYNLVNDYLLLDKALSETALGKLDAIADRLGLSRDVLLEKIQYAQ